MTKAEFIELFKEACAELKAHRSAGRYNYRYYTEARGKGYDYCPIALVAMHKNVADEYWNSDYRQLGEFLKLDNETIDKILLTADERGGRYTDEELANTFESIQ